MLHREDTMTQLMFGGEEPEIATSHLESSQEIWVPADSEGAFWYMWLDDLVAGEDKAIPADGINKPADYRRLLVFLVGKLNTELVFTRQRKGQLMVRRTS